MDSSRPKRRTCDMKSEMKLIRGIFLMKSQSLYFQVHFSWKFWHVDLYDSDFNSKIEKEKFLFTEIYRVSNSILYKMQIFSLLQPRRPIIKPLKPSFRMSHSPPRSLSTKLILSRNDRRQNRHDFGRRCRGIDLIQEKWRNVAVFKRASLREITTTKFRFSILVGENVGDQLVEFLDDST